MDYEFFDMQPVGDLRTGHPFFLKLFCEDAVGSTELASSPSKLLEPSRTDLCFFQGLNVFERSSDEDMPYSASSYTKRFGYLFACLSISIPTMNDRNICISDLRHGISLSFEDHSVLALVLAVFLDSAPSKIAQVVVVRIPVREMPALHPLRAGSNEGFEHESVNPAGPRDSIGMESNAEVFRFLSSKFKHLTVYVSDVVLNRNISWKGLDSSSVADSEEAFVSYDIPPVFLVAVWVELNSLVEFQGSVDVAIGHDSSPVKNFQRIENGQAVWKPLFGNDPSPSYSKDFSRNGKGVAA